MRLNDKKKILQALAAGVAPVLILTSALWAQTTTLAEVRLHALHAAPGKPSVYEIAFIAQETLTLSAGFVFEFPAEFDLSQLQIAGSPDMSGGFTLTRDKQKVRVQRSGLGQSVASGTLVRLRLGAIINPKNFASTGEVTLQVRASAQSAAAAFAKQRVAFQNINQRE